MTNTTGTKAKAEAEASAPEAEVKSISEQADDAIKMGGSASLITLASLIKGATPEEVRYIGGLAAIAEASKLADSTVYRLVSGQTIGLTIESEVRNRYNTGSVTKADGTVADPLASDSFPSDAAVRLALGLNAEGSRYPLTADKLAARSDVQRYCDLAKCEAIDIEEGWAASLAAGTDRDYIKTVAHVVAAKLWRTDATKAKAKADAKAERDALREEASKLAKAKADEEAKAEEASKAVESPIAIDPAWSGAQIRSAIRALNGALTNIAKAEAEAKAKAEAEASALATLAEASGMTVEALREMLAAKANAEA